jgi:hypothetical protein
MKDDFYFLNLGSRMSLKPSPNILIPKTQIAIVKPGKKLIQGALRRKTFPPLKIFPQLGNSGGTPTPKKLRLASDSME